MSAECVLRTHMCINMSQSSLDVGGFTPAEQFDLFCIVAAILHIGNVTITETGADDAQAEKVCHLLGIQMYKGCTSPSSTHWSRRGFPSKNVSTSPG